MRTQKDEENYIKSGEEMRLKEDKERCKGYDVDNRKMEHENKTKDEENKKEEERKNEEDVGVNRKEANNKTEEGMRLEEKEESKYGMFQDREKEVKVVRANDVQEKREGQNENMVKTENSSQTVDCATWTSSNPDPAHSESATCPISPEATPQQHITDKNVSHVVDCENQAARPSNMSVVLPVWLPERTEQKRLSWMKDCIPWSKLSLRNRRKQKGSVRSRRGPRRAAEAGSLPPLCPDSLLQSTGRKSLKEVTFVQTLSRDTDTLTITFMMDEVV